MQKNPPKILIWANIAASVVIAFLMVYVVLAAKKRSPLNVSVDRVEFPVKGIDVSHHNGEIDFAAVSNDSVSFVIMKATEGTSFIDPNLLKNFVGARHNNLATGLYHYFSFGLDGHSQATHFLNTIYNLDSQLPLAVDFEDDGDTEPTVLELALSRLRDMVDDLSAAGHRVMIYTNLNRYPVISKNFKDTYLWLASNRPPSDTVPERTIWQHSHRGTVKGISGDVDINAFNGTALQFRQWLQIDSIKSLF